MCQRKCTATAEAMAVIRAGNASPTARARRHQAAATSRPMSPNTALIPAGAIDVAARLTWTCHDTRRRGPRTCERRRRTVPRGTMAQWLNGRLQLIAGLAAARPSVSS